MRVALASPQLPSRVRGRLLLLQRSKGRIDGSPCAAILRGVGLALFPVGGGEGFGWNTGTKGTASSRKPGANGGLPLMPVAAEPPEPVAVAAADLSGIDVLVPGNVPLLQEFGLYLG